MDKQFQALRAALVAQFPERSNIIDGSLAAVLAGEHVLLIGPPGTAKSALVRSVAQSFGGSYFERLLTKFSTPEELFGPISLKALEQDRFARVTAGKLPVAAFAFIDEIFKSSSAVLNSLLSIVNERTFHNDGAPMLCPLVSLFGASNELPEGRDLEALFDRFLLRFDVGYLLVASNLRGVLTGPEPAITTQLTMDELRLAQAEVAAVKVTDETVDALLSIRDACRGESIIASDRRWKKSLKLVKAAAWLAGEMPQRVTYRGAPCEVRLSLALSNSGDLQVELIQQLDDTPSIFTEFLTDTAGGFHQLAYWADDFDAAMAKLADAGWPLVWSGGEGEGVRFAYLEPPTGAAIVEIMELTEASAGMAAYVRQQAADWDGGDPVRELGG